MVAVTDTLRNANMTVDAEGRVLVLKDSARYGVSVTPVLATYLYTGLGHLFSSDYETISPDGYTVLSATEESLNDAMGNWVGRLNSASTGFSAPGGGSFFESNTTRLGRYDSHTGRLVADSLVGDRTDTLEYDAAGNVHAMVTVNGGSPERYQDRVSYYSVDGKLAAADARGVAMGTTALRGHTAFEEYRYDALGRRIWTRARRWCDDVTGATGGADAVACEISSVRRTVWDGSQELAEIQMPATDSTASTTVENDTLPITRSVPGSGDALYDANRLYGQVLYINGLETDRPLAITRNHYADASKIAGSGSVSYAVYAPFSIIPLWNSQGRADRAVIGGTAAPGQDYLCTDTGQTRCAEVFLDQGVFPYARSGAAMGSWNGTVLIDKADATGTYYRRNRTYDPSTARFTQEDPIGLAGGMNAYGFASGDPANYADPFGLCKEDEARSPTGYCINEMHILGGVISIIAIPIMEATDAIGIVAKGFREFFGGKVKRSRVALDEAKQGKHILGHNNYQLGRSILTHEDPQGLLDDFAGSGQAIRGVRGTPGFKERINFGEPIGEYIDPFTQESTLTQNGIIHYAKDGAHIVPARP